MLARRARSKLDLKAKILQGRGGLVQDLRNKIPTCFSSSLETP